MKPGRWFRLARFAVVGITLVATLCLSSVALAEIGGGIHGRVLDAKAGLPLAGIRVAWGHSVGGGGYDTNGDVHTDAGGFYDIPDLVPGEYMLYIEDELDRYQPLYYKNSPLWATLEHVTVSSGATATPDDTQLRPYAHLAGSAHRRSTGDPVEGAGVYAFKAGAPGAIVDSTSTDASGNYVFTHVVAGDYWLTFIGPDRNLAHGYSDAAYPGRYEYYVSPSRSDTVTVASDGETSTVPLSMPLARNGTITAFAVDWLTGDPISDPFFTCWGNEDGTWPYGGGGWDYGFPGQTVTLVTPGYWHIGYYENVNPQYLYYGASQSTAFWQNADTFRVTDGEDIVVTARLFPNTSAAGKVTRASDGAAVPNTTVEPYVKIEGVWTLARLGILSDGEGNWSFPNIPPDTYRWKFTPPDGSKLVTSYFTDGSTVASDVALVPYGGGTSGINQALVGDTAPPTSWATVSPPAAGTGWSNAAVATVTIEATDGPTGVGVAAVGYRVNSQPTTSTYSGPVGISAEGTTTVAFAATDNFGNAEAAHGVTLRLDRTVPGLAHAIQPAIGLSTCSLEASDALSGVSAITYRVNGAAETTYTTALVLGVGSHQIVARAIDNAGNSRSETFAVDVAPLLPATVSLGTPSLSPSKPKHGKNAAFTSTISPADATKAAVTTLSLWRQETKKVKRKKVKYWHLRKKITMKLVAGKLKATYKLPYAGKWQTQSSFAGTDGFMAAASKMKSFTVK